MCVCSLLAGNVLVLDPYPEVAAAAQPGRTATAIPPTLQPFTLALGRNCTTTSASHQTKDAAVGSGNHYVTACQREAEGDVLLLRCSVDDMARLTKVTKPTAPRAVLGAALNAGSLPALSPLPRCAAPRQRVRVASSYSNC